MATNLSIQQGATFGQVLNWATGPVIYKPISAITKAAPAVISSTAHGIPPNWLVAVVSVLGMAQINAANSPPKQSDFVPATVVDANTISLDSVNAAGYSAYQSGGYLQFLSPVDLTGFTARMSIKDKVGGTELLRLTTENSRIAIDATNKTITLTIDAVTTQAITWTRGVFDLEMVSPAGVVDTILSGSVTVVPAVTLPA